MRFISLISFVSAVAAAATSPSKEPVNDDTLKTSSHPSRIPHFFEEWNQVMAAAERLAKEVASNVDEADIPRFAHFPGVIGI